MPPVSSSLSLPLPYPSFWTGLFMISLGITKQNSKTIRNPGANLWFSLLGRWAVVPGRRGRVLAAAQPCGARAPRGVPGPSAQSRRFSALRARTPRPRAPPAPCVLLGSLPGARRPLRSLRTRGARPLWGSAQARGRCCHPLHRAAPRGAAFFFLSYRAGQRKEGACARSAGAVLRRQKERPGLRRTD